MVMSLPFPERVSSQEIYSVLLRNPEEWLSTNAICERSGLHQQTTKSTLKQLHEKGHGVDRRSKMPNGFEWRLTP